MDSASYYQRLTWMMAGEPPNAPPEAATIARSAPRAHANRAGDDIHPELMEQLAGLARTPLLLVACDYDGTLADLTADPARAFPNRKSMVALHTLAGLPWTTTTIISGRALQDLTNLAGAASPVLQVGSHGAEWKDPGVPLTVQQRDRLARIADALREIAGKTRGATCELKPAGAALHIRNATDAAGDAAIAEALSRCRELPDVHVRHGGKVVEFMVVPANKGDALRHVRFTVGASAVIFLGDDLTDEDAFKSLHAHDLSIKVGPGETAARHRVADPDAVAEVLGAIASLRAAWIQERRLTPLDQCAVLSDQRTMAVVSPGAAISWLCLPRLDSAALFARLISDEAAGSFEIASTDGAAPLRCGYDGDSFILVTEWPGLRVTDYLDCTAGRAFQKAGRSDLVRVIEGTAAARIRFAPRLDYGRIPTQLRVREGGLEVEGSNDPIVLRSGAVQWTIVGEGAHQTAEAVVNPAAGPIVLELRYGTASLHAPAESEPSRRDQNRRFWSGWAHSLQLPAQSPELVKRSALVLKALCHGPTGVIAAAATTSLPEQIGGVRNWDYRYCWPRDAAESVAAMVRLGNTGHALKFLDWMLEVVDRCETPDRLHPIYTLSGGHLPPEAELGHLAGFAQSKPVRVGNAASNQVQLDVFGPIANLVAMLAERGAPIPPDHWRLVRAMVRAVENRWHEPDHGIWEMRLERRHHVHSKVMCWHTIARALVVEEAVCGTRNPEWVALASTIRADVLARGWSDELGAFIGAYDHCYLDAAVLNIGLTGLVESGDPRWAATIDMVSRQLRDGPTVRRYHINDGLPGGEGGMHLCTGWLIEALLTVGRIDEAASLFQDFTAMVCGPGILSEQFDPRHKLAAGNLAQAYSHLALINAAVALDRARNQPRSPA